MGKIQEGTATLTINIGSVPLNFDLNLFGYVEGALTGMDTVSISLDNILVAHGASVGCGQACECVPGATQKCNSLPVQLAAGSSHTLTIQVTSVDQYQNGGAPDGQDCFWQVDLMFYPPTCDKGELGGRTPLPITDVCSASKPAQDTTENEFDPYGYDGSKAAKPVQKP